VCTHCELIFLYCNLAKSIKQGGHKPGIFGILREFWGIFGEFCATSGKIVINKILGQQMQFPECNNALNYVCSWGFTMDPAEAM